MDVPVCRRTAVLAGTAAVETVLLALSPQAWHGLTEPSPGSLPADRAGGVLAGALVLAATVACTCGCLLVVLAAAEHVGRAATMHAVPPGWRPAVAACLGVAVAAGTATAAAGTEPGGPRLDGLPL